MKRALSVVVLVPMLLFAGAGTIVQTFEFKASDFVFDKVNGYDVVALAGQYSTSEPGSPNLPLAVYNLVIPPDAEVSGVEVGSIQTEVLPGKYLIHPCQKPYVLSKAEAGFVEPKAEVYASGEPYPQPRAEVVRSGCLGGYRVAGLQIAPLQYVAAEGQLRLATRLEVAVRYESGRHDVMAFDESQKSLLGGYVQSLVRNPEQVAVWSPETRLTDDWRCDLMVITSAALRASFQPFVDRKTRRGFKTVTVTTESVYATYPGRDNQEKIRACVIDFWQNHGLKWLLVGGDDGIVPVRLARQTVEGITEDIATDLYYADLQYSWDSNHNNLFGEMGDSMDLFYDVFVGRWCCDNAADVALFFAKDTMYEGHPDTTCIKKVLFGSTMLFSPFHGKVINHIIADLFPPGWQFAHLEDPPSGQYASYMNQGYQFAHVAAHGNQTTFSVMNASEAPGLTNGFRKLNYVNSIACQSGWFDGYECLAEALVKAPNGGCIATMLNSRYGFGYPPGFGPSEMLDEQFYIEGLNRRAGQFGSLCALSKDYFRTLTLNQEVWRWCVYELNLLGDPTLSLWYERPRTLSVNTPGSVPTGPQTCRVSVLDGPTPVNGAQVCLQKGTETYARGWTNSQGWVDLFVNPLTDGSISVSASSQNYYPWDGQVPVTGSSSAPALVFASFRIDDADGNGKLEPGESADLYVSLVNSGAVAATGVTAKLRPFSSFITMSDSVSSYGTIGVGNTVEGDRFRVTASGAMPSGTLAEFVAAAIANEGAWQPFFSFLVGDLPPGKKLWADHDLGNMILTVTTLGSIGSLGPYREGSGLKYPRTAAYGSLYFASLACGNSPDYVVDRWYGQPSSTFQTDWRALETLRAVVPPMAAEQEYRCVIDDAAHATPNGLAVTQWSGSLSNPAYDDFVIITYTLENRGASPINGLYCGIFSDFDVNNVTSNSAGIDVARRMASMTDNSTAWVGVKLLAPPSAANVSAIPNAQYVQPSGMMTEAVKDSFLRGSRTYASGSGANYSCMASAGPFNLAPGARQRVAFAMVGGESQTELQVNADSAQSWYDNEMPVGLTYLRSTIDDAPPGGNGDGILNPGESINLPTWVVNRADHAASGVWGILRKTPGDTLVTVTDSVRRLGLVGAGDSAWTGANGFKLRVAPACTNGYVLPMVLVCRDTMDTSYVSSPNIRVGAAQLVPLGVRAWDANGRIDPGDNVEISVAIGNIGLGNAQNVSARLKSGDPRFVILDSLGSYGDIPHDSSLYNVVDRYFISASASIPPETQIPCTMFITASGYHAERAFNVGIGVLTAIDPIPDGPRTPALFYAFDDVDTFYVEHPTYNWIECRGRGTRLTLSDDQTVPVALPTAFGPWRYYDQRYTQLSICSNGFVMPGSATPASWTNAALPTTSLAAPAVCAGWDDLYPAVGGGVWWFHDTANHAFVVEWDSVAYYSPREQWDKFEILVYDTVSSPDHSYNMVVAQYQTANNYVSNTVGSQDPTQAIGIGVLYNGAYHRAASQVIAGRAISFRAGPPHAGTAESGPRRADLGLRVAPNPVRSRTQIAFQVPEAGRTKLEIVDITGRRVRTLLDAELKPGRYQMLWDRRDGSGREVAAGVYVYRLETRAGQRQVKVVVVD